MEIESEEGPLTFSLSGNSLDGRDMEGHKDSLGIIWDEDCVIHFVNINKARFEVFRELFLILICLNVLHALYLLLFGATLDLSTLPSLAKFNYLTVLELTLGLLARLLLTLNLKVFGAKASLLDLTSIHMASHAY
jgi:hypothetical protein